MTAYIFYITVLTSMGAYQIDVKKFDNLAECAEFLNTKSRSVVREYHDTVNGRIVERGCKPNDA